MNLFLLKLTPEPPGKLPAPAMGQTAPAGTYGKDWIVIPCEDAENAGRAARIFRAGHMDPMHVLSEAEARALCKVATS